MTEIQKYEDQELTTAQLEREATAIEKVRAALTIAKKFPRDEIAAWHSLSRTCQRLRFAEQATYTYQRGGSPVTGPSIRLAEAAARALGNIQYGWDVTDSGPDWTAVEAWAHDVENNTRASRTFRVRHYRDTRSGPRLLTAERDVYELVASYAQRRVRACLLQIIPRDIVDEAVDACADVLARGDDTPIEVRVRKMTSAFGALSVTPKMIELHIGKSLKSATAQDLSRLVGVYNAIRNGEGFVDDYFRPEPSADAEKETSDKLERELLDSIKK